MQIRIFDGSHFIELKLCFLISFLLRFTQMGGQVSPHAEGKLPLETSIVCIPS